MTKAHHATVSFEEANSQAAKEMRDKLNKQIESAKKVSATVVARVLEEIPKDRIKDMRELDFSYNEDAEYTSGLVVRYPTEKNYESIHPFALSKMCESINIPKEIITRALSKGPDDDAWGPKLATRIMNEYFKHQPKGISNKLIRSVNNQTRGFLSDAYARLHPGKLLETFAEECQKYGLISYGGHASDTKFYVKATLDRVIEPIKDEVLGIGVVFKESPYGDGASELSFQIERMWCTNKAIRESQLRKVHIGSRAALDMSEADEQYKNNTNMMVQEMRRTMRELFGGDSIKQLSAAVVDAHNAKVNHTQFESFLKKYLNKSDVEEVKEVYRSTNITELPPGDSWWRASNALSFYANKQEDEETALELQKLAGVALKMGTKK